MVLEKHVDAQAYKTNALSTGEDAHGSPVMSECDMPVINTRDFSFSYPGGETVLEGLDWQLNQGEFAVLTGKTGSGKTTLLRNLKPELAPQGVRKGMLLVFGQELSECTVADSALRIGYVAQNPETQIVCDEVWHELAFGLENLACSQDVMRRRIAEVAQFFGIAGWMHRHTSHLSGGQKQLLNLASVLVMQPRLLLLDEPCAQLDPVAEKNFLHELFRVNRELGITVVVATHTPEAVEAYATYTYVVCDKKIIACDNQTTYVSRNDKSHQTTQTCQSSQVEQTGRTPHSTQTYHIDNTPQAGHSLHTSRTPQPDNTLSLTDVYFRYNKDSVWVARGLDFSVQTGEIHALVGGNGSGKSTLLQLCAGALKAQRGRVRNAYLGAQALLVQDPKALFVCDSVIDELMEWASAAGYTQEVAECEAKRFGLSDALSMHPYDLSGGQKQLLAIAKLALTPPRLLLLDEPTKGLDVATKVQIARLLAALSHDGVTIVLATHDLELVSCVADRVSMIFDGEIASTESTDEFFQNNLFYCAPYTSFTEQFYSRLSEAFCDNGCAESDAGEIS